MSEAELPITIGLWLLALIPFVVLLVLLVIAGWKATEAGPMGLLAAALIAVLAFRTPMDTLGIAAGKGVWDAIFILYVIWPALLLYLVTERAGAFEALRRGIERFSKNQLFLVLAFGWVFASFLQGIAGFGTPIAVVAPLLLALGVRPIYAVAIPLVGHAWANFFGTLGVSWLATQRVIELADPGATAWQTALLLWIPNLLAGFAIAWMFGRGPALRAAWPLILIISLIHGGGQLALSIVDPVLANFIPALAAVAALYPLSRWNRYSERDESIEERPAMKEQEEGEADSGESPMSLWMAVLPYAILTVVAVSTLPVPGAQERLGQFEFGLSYPGTTTGFGVNEAAEAPYSPLSPFTHPGAFLLIASLATFVIYWAKGYYEQQARQEEAEQGFGEKFLSMALPSSVAVVAFLATSQILSHSGQTRELALGISEVAPALVYAGLANFIGVLGAFMTSSNTASNVLFSPLQSTIAQSSPQLSQATIISAQSVGGAIGNAIAPANVVLGTGPAGIAGQEGQVLRKTLGWAFAAAVIAGAATVGLEILLPNGGGGTS